MTIKQTSSRTTMARTDNGKITVCHSESHVSGDSTIKIYSSINSISAVDSD